MIKKLGIIILWVALISFLWVDVLAQFDAGTAWIKVVQGEWWSTWEWFIGVVKNVINYILLFLWLIALIMLLWWGFQMVTAAWDDGKYQKWFTILKQAGIWIAIIWFSWLIVSLIFFVVWNASGWEWSWWWSAGSWT